MDRCRSKLAYEDEDADTRGTATGPRGAARDYGRERRYGRPYSRRRSGGSGGRSAGGSGALNMFARLGFVARGIAGIGIAALNAAVTYDAARAKGVDGVLRSFAQSPFGPWLLILVALGLIAFGIFRSSRRNGAAPSAESPSEYAMAHCAAWPATAAASQPSRFDIACAQLTTARTWPESSAARHRTDHG